MAVRLEYLTYPSKILLLSVFKYKVLLALLILQYCVIPHILIISLLILILLTILPIFSEGED